MQTKQKKEALAMNGGTPVMRNALHPVHVVGKEEFAAVKRVIVKGPLSGFAGVAGPKFWGGSEVRAFEKEFAKKFKVKHALGFNSATTALHAAIVALGIGPGDEVIVSPYTMCASATAIMMNGATPIFADVDEKTFCMDSESVRKRITKRTKALMVVNLMGQAADLGNLIPLAKKHNLAIIEDNSQSPGAKWNGKYLGTIGDIGIFSLNVHKAMQTGEGGILVTNNDRYALRAGLSRNHGEAVVDEMGKEYDAGPIFGSNYRMTEVIAAMARVQLRKLDFLTSKRLILATRLTKALKKIPGLTPPFIHPGNTHVYHRYMIKVDEKKLGLSRDTLVRAMAAEGFFMSRGYIKPVHLLRVFQERKAFNNTGFPFEKNTYYDGNPDYSRGSLPVVERLYDTEVTFSDICQYPYTAKHVDLFVTALKKVLAHKHELV